MHIGCGTGKKLGVQFGFNDCLPLLSGEGDRSSICSGLKNLRRDLCPIESIHSAESRGNLDWRSTIEWAFRGRMGLSVGARLGTS